MGADATFINVIPAELTGPCPNPPPLKTSLYGQTDNIHLHSWARNGLPSMQRVIRQVPIHAEHV